MRHPKEANCSGVGTLEAAGDDGAERAEEEGDAE